MTKRRKLLLIVLAIMVSGLVTMQLSDINKDKEPVLIAQKKLDESKDSSISKSLPQVNAEELAKREALQQEGKFDQPKSEPNN